MKILFFTNIPSPYRVDFFNALNKFCDLFVLYEAKIDLECPKNTTDEERMNFDHHYLSESKSYRDFLLSGLWFVLTAKYDRLILHTWYSRTQLCLISLLRILNKKYWIETDGNTIDTNENSLKKRFKQWIFGGAEGFYSSCKNSDVYFVYYGVDRTRIHRYSFTSVCDADILPQVLSQSKKNEIREKLGIQIDAKVVLAVGRFIPVKGFDILIKASTPEWHVYIVGGEITAEYCKLRKDLNLEDNVHFVSYCQKDELSNYYKAADIFVLPTRGDSWGLVINEAMSYGLPVITTDHCGSGLEMLDCQDITIVPSENIVALNRSISHLLEDNNLRSKIGLRNLEYAREHTIERMAKEHINTQ